MEIKKFTPKDHWLKVLVYGPSGAGKTVFAGTAKDALFLSAEGGLLSIKEKNPDYVDIKSLNDLQQAYIYLKKGDHNYKTVVIDSITQVNEIIKAEIEKRNGHFMQKSDWGELQNKIEDILQAIHKLSMNVIMIAQEQSEKDEEKTVRILPSLNGKASTRIASLMDVVAYIMIEKSGKRKIITSSNHRLLTKDRINLIGDDAEPDFEKWIEKAQEMKIGEETMVHSENIDVPVDPPPGVNPDEIIRGLRVTLWDKMQKKRSKEKASAILKDWLKYIYNTESSSALNIDQLNTMHQILDEKNNKEIEDMLLNHDARKPS